MFRRQLRPLLRLSFRNRKFSSGRNHEDDDGLPISMKTYFKIAGLSYLTSITHYAITTDEKSETNLINANFASLCASICWPVFFPLVLTTVFQKYIIDIRTTINKRRSDL